MQIVDLTNEHLASYLLCLEDWNPDVHEAGSRRAQWYEKMRDRGLRVKLALDDRGQLGGMIQYLPIEHSVVDGSGLYFVPCIWVHGYPQGRGDFRRQGMGRALLAAAEEDARERGAKGIAAWGLGLPFWMKASWFKRYGFVKADRTDLLQVLVWKRFAADAEAPRWFRQQRKPEQVPGKVTVTALVNGWCMGMNLAYERAKRAAAELGERVELREVDTSERAAVAEWGLSDALFIDGRRVRTGPPPSYDKIRKLIARRMPR